MVCFNDPIELEVKLFICIIIFNIMTHIATDNLTVNNLGQFNKIASPESYSDEFTKECLQLEELAQYVYFDEVPVGFVVSNVLQPQNSGIPIGLVISILKVLPAYAHRYGLEDALIHYVEKTTTEKRLLHRIFLLLDPKKDEWLITYARKHGFGEDTKTPVHIDSKHQLDSKGKILLVKHV